MAVVVLGGVGVNGEGSESVPVGVLVWTLTSASLLVSASVSVSKISVTQNMSFSGRKEQGATCSRRDTAARKAEVARTAVRAAT